MQKPESLAELVRRMRQNAGLTLEDLSHRAGVSVRSLGDIERGVRDSPRTSTLVAVARGLGLSADQQDELLGLVNVARALDPGSFPATLSPPRLVDFAGRASELDQVLGALLDDSAVVVITGSAGFGKTTLAVEATGRLSDSSTLFLDLGALGREPLSPLQVVQALLRAANVEPADIPGSLEEATARWTGTALGSRTIVILDNVISESQVRPALSGGGRYVLTSRRTVAGITATSRVHLGSLDDKSSVALLESVIPEAQRHLPDVDELVALCQGVPLALRVAGNRIASRQATTVGDFVARLRQEERRLSLLVAGDMSVEAALNTSFEELDADTARFFANLSLIDGTTFSAELAAAASGLDAGAAEELVEDLVDAGLVEARGGSRYRLHDLIRVFAGSRARALMDSSEIQSSRTRLAYALLRTVVSLGRAATLTIPTDWPGSALWFAGSGTDAGARAWTLAEADHWWPAIQFLRDHGDNVAVLLAGKATESRVSQWPESPQLFGLQRLALEAAENLGDLPEISLRLSSLAWSSFNLSGDLAVVADYATRALQVGRLSGDKYALARSLMLDGCVRLFRGDFGGVEVALRQAIDMFTTLGDDAEAAEARSILGVFYRRADRRDDAVRELEAVLAFTGTSADSVDAEPIQMTSARGNALSELSACYSTCGSPARALQLADLLVDQFRGESDYYRARARSFRARALLAVGDPTGALEEADRIELLLAPYPSGSHAASTRSEIAELRSEARLLKDG